MTGPRKTAISIMPMTGMPPARVPMRIAEKSHAIRISILGNFGNLADTFSVMILGSASYGATPISELMYTAALMINRKRATRKIAHLETVSVK